MGTVRANRKNMPTNFSSVNMSKGDPPIFKKHDDLLACSWHDTKRVNFLSTICDNGTVPKRIRARGMPDGHRSVDKPRVAERYNKSMGGVDTFDQKVGTFSYMHKAHKWYHVIYHRLRETALVNAYILYQEDPVFRPLA